jgi:hypothetical protein
MSYVSFNPLAHKLKPFMQQRHFSMARRNGPIYHSVRVTCAIRYFAGGSPYDLATTFGIAVSEVFESVCEVVNAVNQHPDFTIKYPDSHDKQRQIALGFKEKLGAGFDSCAGAIDGILIWIHKQSLKCSGEASCDAGKSFCGQKLKFGLNCQAVCDANE